MQSVGFEVRITGSCSSIKYCTKSVYPQSRAHHGACQHDNWVYILAGKDGNITLKDFWRFHLGNQNWEKLSYRGDLPHHLQGHTLLSFRKLLLLFGGEFGDALTESSLWIINPDLGYVRKACLDVGSERPCVRRYHSAVIYRDSMYVYGGYVDVKGSSSEFWRYNVEDEDWELLLPSKHSKDRPGRRYGHSAVMYKESMWIYGGMNNLVPKQDLWTYSFISERWERIKFKIGPPALTCHSAVVVGSQMVVYGGETNREPVNHVWTFNFITHKWTQVLFMGQDPPCKALHMCVMVNPAAWNVATVKARSTPYLQNKAKEHTKRPKSSPGYRLNAESIQKDNQNIMMFERTNSAIEIDMHNHLSSNLDSCSVCKTRINCSYHQSMSKDIHNMHPSPSENSKDILPLVPPETDINYNDIYMLDKDAVNNGLDNPGISDSTEKLIEESQNHRVCSRKCAVSNRMDIDCQCTDRETHPEKRKMCTDCVTSANTSSMVKKYRLDRDLILEDLEFQDCFPYNIQVPFPASSQISLQRTCRDPENMEIIELTDFTLNNTPYCGERGLDKTSNCAGSALNNTTTCGGNALNNTTTCGGNACGENALNNTTTCGGNVLNNTTTCGANALNNTTNCGGNALNNTTNCGERGSVSSSSTTSSRRIPSQSINYDIFSVMCQAHTVAGQQDTHLPKTKIGCDISTQGHETSFQHTQNGHLNSQCTSSERKTALHKTEVPERPYVLVIGGKDKQSVNFTTKPLALMKIQLSFS